VPAVPGGPRLLFLNHVKGSWVDLSADKKALKAEAQGEAEAELNAELLAAMQRYGGVCVGGGGGGGGLGGWGSRNKRVVRVEWVLYHTVESTHRTPTCPCSCGEMANLAEQSALCGTLREVPCMEYGDFVAHCVRCHVWSMGTRSTHASQAEAGVC
jgi:hypothetical protein